MLLESLITLSSCLRLSSALSGTFLVSAGVICLLKTPCGLMIPMTKTATNKNESILRI